MEALLTMLTAITVHEWAHAWTADRLRDITPALYGRVSLNPIRHVDPVGTILVPLASWYALGICVGWGRRVPIAPEVMGHVGTLLVLAAGPAANALLGAVCGLLGWRQAAWANACLALFNLLPVGRLDGGRILDLLIGMRRRRRCSRGR